MRSFVICFFIWIGLGFSADADIIIINGNKSSFSVEQSALEQHPDISAIKKHLTGYESGACFDCDMVKYIAEWTLIDKTLYLTGIYPDNAKREKGEKADISQLFNVKDSKVKADWVNAEFWVPVGKSIRGHDVWPVYGAELYLLIKNGQVVKQQNFNYPTEPLMDNDAQQHFIYNHINWDKVPALGNAQKKVFITFQTGASGKPENVNVVRPTDCSLCNTEAIQAVSLLPWPADYRQGKVWTQSWSLPVIFSEEIRKNIRTNTKFTY